MDDTSRINDIIDMYSGLTYSQVYGNQIAWVIFMTIADILLILYFYLKKNARSFKENWVSVRCNWNIMPFAGFINKPSNKTIIEYTQENYDYCTKQSLEKSMEERFESTFNTQNQINDMITNSNNLMAKSIAISNNSNTNVNQNINYAAETIQQIFNLLNVGFVLFMDTLMKLSDILKTIISFGFTGITWATVFFKMMISAIMTLLIILFATTVIPAIPFFWLIFPLIYAIVFAFLMVIASSFENTVYTIADAFSSVEPFTTMKPKLNLCFGENTRIQTKDGCKKIKNIKVGDILSDSRVTATFKTIVTHNLYNLNGVVVTGEHYVKYNEWIKVKDHPKSVPIKYNGKYLYCLNTTSKTITIGNNIFLDWDELLPDKMEHVLKIYKTLENIHRFDEGFSSLSIKRNGECKDISEIEPNDVLEKDVRVIAKVCLKDKYHLVTDTGYFNEFNDYNYNIDKLFSDLII